MFAYLLTVILARKLASRHDSGFDSTGNWPFVAVHVIKGAFENPHISGVNRACAITR
jgi:hypothetical protein